MLHFSCLSLGEPTYYNSFNPPYSFFYAHHSITMYTFRTCFSSYLLLLFLLLLFLLLLLLFLLLFLELLLLLLLLFLLLLFLLFEEDE